MLKVSKMTLGFMIIAYKGSYFILNIFNIKSYNKYQKLHKFMYKIKILQGTDSY